jgi:uncharacterized repeat protein (TIGR04138 family)
MTTFLPRLLEVVRHDPRYAYEAYEFVFAALDYTQCGLGRAHDRARELKIEKQQHVSGRELVLGIRELALREFGLMARVVFRLWGINRTGDFGEIVFNLITANLMTKTEHDSRDDFQNVYDLDRALTEDFRIQVDEAEWTR